MRRLLNNKYISYIYFLFLIMAAVLPLNSGSFVLNNHYTLDLRWDYLLHAIVYIPLPVLLGLSLNRGAPEKPNERINKSRSRLLVRVPLYSLIASTLLEGLQLIIPYRAFNINDLIANGVGAMLGVILFLVLGRRLEITRQGRLGPLTD